MKTKPIPVILNTDIGTDIDDTWALAMLLKSPELDLKMVLTDTGDTAYRAKIVAKMLEVAKRTDVAVGIGIPFEDNLLLQEEWIRGYDLSRYPGPVKRDGVQALIDLAMASPEPLTLISISPVPNLGIALEREPRIAGKLRFVGMYGSVYKGYGDKSEPDAEANVRMHTPACQKAFQAPWDMTITPLDTCGIINLDGEHYRRIKECPDPLLRAVVENYRLWAKVVPWAKGIDAEKTTSTLFDTVAVFLAFSEKWLVMKEMGIRVTDDGFTRVDDTAKKMRVALEWEDLAAYKEFLVDRLVGKAS